MKIEPFGFLFVLISDGPDTMLDKNKRKMGISLLLFAAAAMLFRLAYATVQSSVSVWLIGVAVLLVLAAVTLFAFYFRE